MRATIDDIRKLFGVGYEKTCKAVVYKKNKTGDLIVVFLRGDLEVNETKAAQLYRRGYQSRHHDR